MRTDEATKFAECLIGLVDTADSWNAESRLEVVRMMSHPKVKDKIEYMADKRQRKNLIAMGLDITPIHPDEWNDDYETH